VKSAEAAALDASPRRTDPVAMHESCTKFRRVSIIDLSCFVIYINIFEATRDGAASEGAMTPRPLTYSFSGSEEGKSKKGKTGLIETIRARVCKRRERFKTGLQKCYAQSPKLRKS
jgi:hypothetical protein